MMLKSRRSLEEVHYNFGESSIKFSIHTSQKIDYFNPILNKITRPVAAIKSLRFALFFQNAISLLNIIFFDYNISV